MENLHAYISGLFPGNIVYPEQNEANFLWVIYNVFILSGWFFFIATTFYIWKSALTTKKRTSVQIESDEYKTNVFLLISTIYIGVYSVIKYVFF